ncbi:MAG TPA: DUF4126 domain-containing protein [Thermomicrobiales bacterium]|nr:DUF4126 domain-containing protein [Thermomicrobiales bacterium]
MLLSTLLAGFGLSASAGLNAYLPLLILALADRFTTTVELDQPYDLLSSNIGILVIMLILPIELILDKIARVDHVNDLVHSVIRPITAAVAFMAFASQDRDINAVGAMIIGLVIGGAVHWLKAGTRPRISARTKGVGNPFISMIEDMLAIALSILAVFLPIAIVAALPFGAWLLTRSYRRMSSGESRLMSLLGNQQPPAGSAT